MLEKLAHASEGAEADHVPVQPLPNLIQGGKPVKELQVLYLGQIAGKDLVEMVMGVDEPWIAPEMASVNHSVGGILQTGADVRNPAVLTKKVHLVDDGITIIACHQGMEIFDQQSGHYDTLLSTFQYRGKKDKGQRRNQSGGRFCGLRSVKAACRRAVASFSRPQSGRPGSLPHSPRRS